jgi:hypothetical protein
MGATWPISIDPLLISVGACWLTIRPTRPVKGKAEVGRTKDEAIHPSEFILHPYSSVTVIDKCGQALKGAWWMSWHREATKDVVACDKLREAGKRALIRRCLNEETQPV